MKPLAGLILATVITAAIGLSAQQRFRTDVSVVTVNVAVRQNGSPVRDLRATDFVVTDNGESQAVELTPAGAMAADITLLVDTSASMDATLEQTRGHLTDIAKQLRHDDRLRVLTFADDVREVFGFRPGGGSPPLDALTAGGWTSIYDALSLAFIHRPTRERGHFIVAFSDGIDSSSTLDLPTLTELSKRSEAVLDLFVTIPRPLNQSRRAMPSRQTPPRPPVSGVADLTGGDTRFVDTSDDIAKTFRDALNEYRRRYVLRYPMPTGSVGSWHTVSVDVKRQGQFDVRARRGYFQ